LSESKIEEWVRLEVSEGVALVTMDCTPVNALNREMRRQLVPRFCCLRWDSWL
jgi:enoyl-CoA hydratase